MLNKMESVVVVGAGPAGLIAAILLARSDKGVVVLDLPRKTLKVGECVPNSISRLLAKLELPDLQQSGSHRRVGGIVSQWGSERREEDYIMRVEGGGWRLDRQEFESFLADASLGEGAQRLDTRMRRAIHRDSGWEIETDSGEILYSDYLIDASGRTAVLAKQQKAERISGPPLVAVWALGRPSGQNPPDRTFIESIEDGWWYGAYLPDNRPLAIFHTSPLHAKQVIKDHSCWSQKLRSTRQLSKWLPMELFDSVSLGALDARSCRLEIPFGPGWAACGDAALSFDPISSQGIFNALASGHLLASALLGDDLEEGLLIYHDQLMQVWEIYMQRRQALYETAAVHFKSSLFWSSQL